MCKFPFTSLDMTDEDTSIASSRRDERQIVYPRNTRDRQIDEGKNREMKKPRIIKALKEFLRYPDRYI